MRRPALYLVVLVLLAAALVFEAAVDSRVGAAAALIMVGVLGVGVVLGWFPAGGGGE